MLWCQASVGHVGEKLDDEQGRRGGQGKSSIH